MTVLGYRIPKGSILSFPHFCIHRDPDVWGPDADKFIPERKWHKDSFLPFTHSPRDCLGRNVAMMEMRVVLVHTFATFNTRLAHPEGPIEEWTATTLTVKNGLELLFEKR